MRFAFELTDEDKQQFLENIYAGMDFARAAADLDSTATQFRKLRSPKSQYYDPVFAGECEIAIRSEEHEQAELEWLRGLQRTRAEEGSDRMIEKLSYAKDPEWEVLRHQNLNVNVKAEVAHKILPYVPRDVLERAIEQAEAEAALDTPRLAALPPPREDQAENLG